MCEPIISANSKPHTPEPINRYAPLLEGRAGRLETKSDLYVLVEVHTERLENPTVFLRLVPSVIAIDTGLVLIDPQLGHLNLSVISIEHHFISDLQLGVAPGKTLDHRVKKSED